ncbi:hypothetical protein [Sulfitobacter donghicola]|uniref:Glycine zipper domain-containing protein n=1 Tax=Sulfitobacter donghicola DSW-25 = KCTC 12864 = JCM 14565 TaxID=1300350 RepID=A0A073IC59_9RHOB|nr:hypothetical protein [Sulfitobacter donghicola]KEJ87913.1 hypothetical protein DSW25_04645 [Sulfitobacter donghicola DSW-25 = KCTC 12864 = JCM 14565]KIN67241.1 hypothetical protein Z948_949 [Sulfitobacter donghicola DSW-25 = KCTC 12864 = JCM 14565]
MRIPTLLVLPFVLSACAAAPHTSSSRSDTTRLGFAAEQPAEIDAQTAALTELSRRIVVQTTLKGAGVGAAIGCGLAVVSAGNAKNCIAAAAAGAAGGAVVGHVAGKRKVNRRVESISPSAVVRTLRKTNTQMSLVQNTLPARLAAQEEALARIDLQRASGQLSAKAYAQSHASIMAERQSIAAALLATERNANHAAANMRNAQNQGQTGLDWHISNADKLAREASSARSSINLL